MIGNVALDVVIGLVFIYLLYSLYATVMMEIVSSLLGLRARNLCYALSRMLMDEKDYEDVFSRKISRLITTLTRVFGKAINLKNRTLYDTFFQQPSVKYLSSGGLGNKPSYLSSESFTKGIIDAIKLDHPDIGLLACIAEGIDKLPGTTETSETKKHLQSLLDDSNYDLTKFRILLENWFNDTMDRATGWFKQSTQVILIVIGFMLTISFNVDTIAIIKKLSNDQDARDQLVKMATDFTGDNAGVIEALRSTTDSAKSVEILKDQLDSLLAIRKSLNKDIVASQNILSSDWHIPNTIPFSDRTRVFDEKDSIQVVHQLPNGKIVYMVVHNSIDAGIFRSVLSDKADDGTLAVNTFRYKLKYVFDYDHIWGYLLSVLALSLGAPFWFDLLNKLIKLRTSKVPSPSPGEIPGSTDSAVSNRAILNRVG